MRILFVIVGCLWGSISFAASAIDASYAGSLNSYGPPYSILAIESALSAYSDIESKDKILNLKMAQDSGAKTSGPATECIHFYDKIKDKGTLEMRIFFGYKDYSHDQKVFTQDYQEKVALERFLTLPCTGGKSNFFACGFSHSQTAAPVAFTQLLVKNYVDSRGQSRVLHLYLSSSSVPNMASPQSESLGSSRQDMSHEQAERSNAINRAFWLGFMDSDILYYVGNIRPSEGPDFFPAFRTAKGIDTGKYAENNRIRFLHTLSKGGVNSSIIGLFANQSKQNLFNFVPPKIKLASFIVNEIGYGNERKDFWYDEPIAIAGSINAILGEYCPSSFEQAMWFDGMDARSKMSIKLSAD